MPAPEKDAKEDGGEEDNDEEEEEGDLALIGTIDETDSPTVPRALLTSPPPPPLPTAASLFPPSLPCKNKASAAFAGAQPGKGVVHSAAISSNDESEAVTNASSALEEEGRGGVAE